MRGKRRKLGWCMDMKFQEFEAKGSKEVGLWLAEKVGIKSFVLGSVGV